MPAWIPPADTEFVVKDAVPLFSECEILDENGRPHRVTPQEIEEIAAVNNAAVMAGEPSVIHVGHNHPKSEEKPIVGFMHKYYTGLRDGLKTVFCQWLVYPEKESELRYYPRRSVEMYKTNGRFARKWVISSVALLGSNDPAVKLGVLCSANEGDLLLRFDMANAEAKTMDDAQDDVPVSEEFKAQFLKMFMATDVVAWAHEQMGAAKADDKAKLSGEAKDGDGDPDSGETDESKKIDESEDEEMKDDEATAEKFSVMSQQIATLQMQIRTNAREKLLMSAESEGYVFNVAEELADCDDLNDAQFTKHIARLKRTSKRAPVGMKFSAQTASVGGSVNDPALSPAKIKAAQALALSKGIRFEQAITQV